MIVLDTHAWIWWVARDKQLSRRARAQIERAKRVLVPTVCLREVALLVAHGRLRFSRGVEEWLDAASTLPQLELAPMTSRIAVESANLGASFHRDPADQIIVATAITYGVPLVTRDERIERYDRVRTIW